MDMRVIILHISPATEPASATAHKQQAAEAAGTTSLSHQALQANYAPLLHVIIHAREVDAARPHVAADLQHPRERALMHATAAACAAAAC